MVTAGVYMIARLNFLFSLSPTAGGIVALVGASTALFAATIGFFQYDIKKVLAYSTVSQLGFMFIAVGVGAYWAGVFHLMTHAFFKACLFLGSGSVIHGMHAVEHDEVAVQDMRNMGGLKRKMPLTARTYLPASPSRPRRSRSSRASGPRTRSSGRRSTPRTSPTSPARSSTSWASSRRSAPRSTCGAATT
jgi:NADH:ubiquinone oxidoreductase subunit 5 (subunit L)/multisubunit Na+/H+ antiporter MnhA subunit